MPEKRWLPSHSRRYQLRGQAADGGGWRQEATFLFCKQVEHLAKFCPQRSKESNQQAAKPKTAAAENAAKIQGSKLTHPPDQAEGCARPSGRMEDGFQEKEQQTVQAGERQPNITTPKATTSRVGALKKTDIQETIIHDHAPLSEQDSE